MADDFSIDVDCATGLVHVVGTGFWSPASITAHFNLLEQRLKAVRARHGMVRALIDLRNAPVQSPETASIIQQATTRIYRPEDRIAIVRSSLLLDLQMKRSVDASPLQTFTTIDEAKAWLA